jgi:hypothetical protein
MTQMETFPKVKTGFVEKRIDGSKHPVDIQDCTQPTPPTHSYTWYTFLAACCAYEFEGKTLGFAL